MKASVARPLVDVRLCKRAPAARRIPVDVMRLVAYTLLLVLLLTRLLLLLPL
jgi:hypothetical protein